MNRAEYFGQNQTEIADPHTLQMQRNLHRRRRKNDLKLMVFMTRGPGLGKKAKSMSRVILAYFCGR